MMSSAPDLLALEEMPLNTQVVGRRFRVFDVLDSTNTYALEEGRAGDVIVADRQTAGRGRQGRTWYSAPGLGLWFTVVFEGPPEQELVYAAALAVRDAAAEQAALRLKWPNDLLLNGKKVCGILIEHRDGRTALGIGVNVHHRPEDFPEELRAKASSLAHETQQPWDRGELLRGILQGLDKRVMLVGSGGGEDLWREWASACGLEGRRIATGGQEGRVVEIDRSGAIVLETPTGLQRVHSGDITILDGD